MRQKAKYRVPSESCAERMFHLGSAAESVLAIKGVTRDPKMNARLDQTLTGLTKMLLACTRQYIETTMDEREDDHDA